MWWMKISFRIYCNYDDKCKIVFDSIFSLDDYDEDGNDDRVCDNQDGENMTKIQKWEILPHTI